MRYGLRAKHSLGFIHLHNETLTHRDVIMPTKTGDVFENGDLICRVCLNGTHHLTCTWMLPVYFNNTVSRHQYCRRWRILWHHQRLQNYRITSSTTADSDSIRQSRWRTTGTSQDKANNRNKHIFGILFHTIYEEYFCIINIHNESA